MANIHSCTCPQGACYVDGKCHYQKDCSYQAKTNADRIRCMSDKELYNFLDYIAQTGPWDYEFERTFCNNCSPVGFKKNFFGREVGYFKCEDGVCPHYNGNALKWWLKEVIEYGTCE